MCVVRIGTLVELTASQCVRHCSSSTARLNEIWRRRTVASDIVVYTGWGHRRLLRYPQATRGVLSIIFLVCIDFNHDRYAHGLVAKGCCKGELRITRREDRVRERW